MGKRIDGPFDAKAMMEHGDGFHAAMLLIGRQPNSELAMTFTPFVTCAAFALEAYLKVLANIERKLLPLKTHHLRYLFEDVSLATQQRLEADWTRDCLPGLVRQFSNPHLPPGFPRVQTFRQALDQSAQAFTEWRYATRDDNRSFHLIDFLPIVRRAVLGQRPDLTTVRRVMKPLDGPLPPIDPSL